MGTETKRKKRMSVKQRRRQEILYSQELERERERKKEIGTLLILSSPLEDGTLFLPSEPERLGIGNEVGGGRVARE